MAQAYPLVTVDGFDLDPDVIAAAGRHAEQAGLSGRVSFAVTDASGRAGPAGMTWYVFKGCTIWPARWTRCGGA